MPNLINVHFNTTTANSDNDLGMRPMQAKVYEERNQQYILIKAPPASGKSRALMFVALDKLVNQGLSKVVIAVPEMSIGSSFKNTDLTSYGFYADWEVEPRYDLCGVSDNGSDASKVKTLVGFLENSSAKILVCTHATLRFAYQRIEAKQLDNCVLAIDEFHHASASNENLLGKLIDGVMNNSSAHIIAMTGSYFRGDTVPIMLPHDEAKFQQVTYSYYEQLSSYKYLKSLGIGYHFYTGNYLTAINEVLDPNKKTIIHIPRPNSKESTGDKYLEVEFIISKLGDEVSREDGDIINVRLHDGRMIKVANLVEDGKTRPEVLDYLRNIKHKDDMDIIIALGMAKEGFDWEYCEHALTVGYRASMTEVVQIIGRATRDSKGKTHAQFTNLIAQPDAEDEEVQNSVNNMIKAITVSLLMEQVLAPTVNFKARSDLNPGEEVPGNTIVIDDVETPLSPEAKKVLENKDNIQAKLLQDVKTMGGLMTNQTLPEVLLHVDLPKLIRQESPNLSENEVETLAEVIFKQLVMQSNGGVVDGTEVPEGAEPYIPGMPHPNTGTGDGSSNDSEPDKKFIVMGNKFINIEDLHVDLIKEINPFQNAYEVLSKSVDKKMFKALLEVVKGMKSTMTLEEAMVLVPRIQEFKVEHDRLPSITSIDDYEQHLGEAVVSLRKERQRQMTENTDS
jgi:hypothetical protein